VWKKSRTLVGNIRSLCKQEQVRKDFSFLGFAKRSAGEVRSHLYDALDERYVSQEQFQKLSDDAKEIGRMLAGLIHYLQSRNPKQKRTLKFSSHQLKTIN